MPLDPAQLPTNIPETIGFRDDALGNLSANWTVVQGAAADLQVKTDTVKIVWNPVGGAAASAIYNARAPQTSRYRAAFSQRFRSGSTGGTVGCGLWSSIPVPFTFAAERYGLTLDATPGATELDIFWPLNNVLVARSIRVTLAANTWYRAAIEVIGPTVNFYFNPTGNSNITNVSSEAALDLVYTTTADPPDTGLLFGMSLSFGAAAANDYNGVGDVSFTGMDEPHVELNASGIGELPLATPYSRYKAVREANLTYNNLVIGP